MKKLQPHETDLIGKWIFSDGEMKGDEICNRIDYLIANVLNEICRDPTGWDILYRDSTDGRYWELTYPQSHMHGGGPPRLTCLSPDQAKEKYKGVTSESSLQGKKIGGHNT